MAFESRFVIMRSIWTRSASSEAVRGQVGGKANAGRFGGDLVLLHQVPRDFAQVEARSLQDHLTGFGLREQQQRAHDLRQPVDIVSALNMASRYCSVVLAVKSATSSWPRMAVMGVRNSWETSVENWRICRKEASSRSIMRLKVRIR